MLDVQSAIGRAQAAGSVEDLQAIVMNDPELQTPEADEALALAENGAILRGQPELAERISALRQVARMMKSSIMFMLPDLPGSREAANEIKSMLNGEIPPLPGEETADVFFTVLAALREQAEQKGLTDLAAAFAGLEQQAQAAIMEQALPPLPRAILEWVDMPGWDESRHFLQEHPELLSDEAATVIGQMLDAARAQNADDVADVLSQHQDILTKTRNEGIAAAYATLTSDDAM